jgi:hypothetical protein
MGEQKYLWMNMTSLPKGNERFLNDGKFKMLLPATL